MYICNECLNDYGPCALFNEYEICIQQLNKTFLRSNVNKEIEIEEDEKNEANDDDYINKFILAGSVVAVAAAAASRDSFWLIKVKDEECVYANPVTDDYGHIIPAGFLFYSGNFLEETHLKGHTYKLPKKLTIFYKESVVSPHVQIKDKKIV